MAARSSQPAMLADCALKTACQLIRMNDLALQTADQLIGKVQAAENRIKLARGRRSSSTSVTQRVHIHYYYGIKP